MEVSSHALALGRTAGIEFAAAIFTNLSRDHLDFHETMEDYFQAKRRLFIPDPAPSGSSPPRLSVVNIGDPFGARLADELEDPVTVAVDQPADYSARAVRVGFGGVAFTLSTPAGEREVSSTLRGRFNVANALGAVAAAHRLGGDLDVLAAALERGVSVPGRFEAVDEGQRFAALVDYAHTPDSLDNVLRAARELAGEEPRGRVVCVFGAGGDRDRGKRPVMGEVATRLADVVIVTSDNPRSEVPEQIIAEIMAGAGGAGRASGAAAGAGGAASAEPSQPLVEAVTDRRAAIARAISLARPGDVVVIAGKGHEQGQEFADGRKVPFDDVTVVREALRALARAPATGPPAGATA